MEMFEASDSYSCMLLSNFGFSSDFLSSLLTLSRLKCNNLFSGWLRRKALSLESFPCLMFPPFFVQSPLFCKTCAAWGSPDASVNLVSWRACLPDNTVFIITDWPHMSSQHWESHVRAHCVVSSVYLVTIINRKQDRARGDKGGVGKTRQSYDLMSAVCGHSLISLQSKYWAKIRLKLILHKHTSVSSRNSISAHHFSAFLFPSNLKIRYLKLMEGMRVFGWPSALWYQLFNMAERE